LLITKNAIILGSEFSPEFGDELLLRMAKELNFDEPQENEAAKQEDGKAILLRWRLKESRKWKSRG
jgi:hypothetical protein